MEKHYCLKLKKGDLEIEVSGSEKEFVIHYFEKLIAEVEKSTTFKPSTLKHSASNKEKKESDVENSNTDDTINDENVQNIFAKSAEVTIDDLNNIYDFNNNEIVIHKTLKGTDAEKHKTIAKLAIIAAYHINKTEGLSGRAIGKYLSELGVGGTANLATNLKRESGINKVKLIYKLNQVGKKEAYQLIKDLSKI